VGILLSGGLDSSANVAIAADCTNQKLKTFSVGFQDPAFDERPYARIVSQHFNTEHFETVVTGEDLEDLPKLIWHLEEPYFEFGLFLTYKALEAGPKRGGYGNRWGRHGPAVWNRRICRGAAGCSSLLAEKVSPPWPRRTGGEVDQGLLFL